MIPGSITATRIHDPLPSLPDSSKFHPTPPAPAIPASGTCFGAGLFVVLYGNWQRFTYIGFPFLQIFVYLKIQISYQCHYEMIGYIIILRAFEVFQFSKILHLAEIFFNFRTHFAGIYNLIFRAVLPVSVVINTKYLSVFLSTDFDSLTKRLIEISLSNNKNSCIICFFMI